MPTGKDLWIDIPRWDEFQHPDAARSQTLPWIKTYTRLLSDDSYLKLTGHQRAVLHGIWLEYARARRQLRLDTISLTRRLSLRVTTQTLEALNHAGLLHFVASKPASNHASTHASTEERRRETEPKAVTALRPDDAVEPEPNGPVIDITTEDLAYAQAHLLKDIR